MSAPLISVVLPVYNGERYLEEALDSVLAQTQQPLDVIVIDDGSSDGTGALLDRYGDRIVRIHQPNKGPGAARNAGVAAARGDFLSFMDADDVWHPEKLERQLGRLLASPGVEISQSYVQNFWIDELQRERDQLAGWAMAKPQLGSLLASILARRAAFDRVGLFDERFRIANDTDWFLRAREQGVAIEPLEEVLLYRRIHATNITRVHSEALRDELAEMVKSALTRRRASARKAP